MSEQASADKLEYTATLGIIAMEGRGFEYPTDADVVAFRCEKVNRPAEFVPAEFAVGIPHMSGEFAAPRREIIPRRLRTDRMAQALNNPPAIEGWRQRLEWLDTAALMERANFVSNQFGDAHKPAIRAMVASIAGPASENAPPETLVDRCLPQMCAPNGVAPRIPARAASASDARQSRNHIITAIIPTTREQAP